MGWNGLCRRLILRHKFWHMLHLVSLAHNFELWGTFDITQHFRVNKRFFKLFCGKILYLLVLLWVKLINLINQRESHFGSISVGNFILGAITFIFFKVKKKRKIKGTTYIFQTAYPVVHKSVYQLLLVSILQNYLITFKIIS